MQPLNLPSFSPRLQREGERTLVYDPLRRRYVVLTPEEWVRQHFVHFLTAHRGYPAVLLANEVSVAVGSVRRRCDTVLYAPRTTRPRLIVEYKAPSIPITQEVFHQIWTYNSVLRADYLIVSNGMAHYCCHVNYASGTVDFLPEVPAYAALEA